jgi:glycine cleavage system H protein
MILYTDTHDWVSLKDGIARIGISKRGQKELGDIVYVQLPKVGEIIEKGEEMAVVESTKAATDIYAPLSIEILSVNPLLEEDASLLNKDPEGIAFVCEGKVLRKEELTTLLSPENYSLLVEG